MLVPLLRVAPQGTPLESPFAREAVARRSESLVTTTDSGEGAEAQGRSPRGEEAGKQTPESDWRQLRNSCLKNMFCFFLKRKKDILISKKRVP